MSPGFYPAQPFYRILLSLTWHLHVTPTSPGRVSPCFLISWTAPFDSLSLVHLLHSPLSCEQCHCSIPGLSLFCWSSTTIPWKTRLLFKISAVTSTDSFQIATSGLDCLLNVSTEQDISYHLLTYKNILLGKLNQAIPHPTSCTHTHPISLSKRHRLCSPSTLESPVTICPLLYPAIHTKPTFLVLPQQSRP